MSLQLSATRLSPILEMFHHFSTQTAINPPTPALIRGTGTKTMTTTTTTTKTQTTNNKQQPTAAAATTTTATTTTTPQPQPQPQKQQPEEKKNKKIIKKNEKNKKKKFDIWSSEAVQACSTDMAFVLHWHSIFALHRLLFDIFSVAVLDPTCCSSVSRVHRIVSFFLTLVAGPPASTRFWDSEACLGTCTARPFRKRCQALGLWLFRASAWAAFAFLVCARWLFFVFFVMRHLELFSKKFSLTSCRRNCPQHYFGIIWQNCRIFLFATSFLVSDGREWHPLNRVAMSSLVCRLEVGREIDCFQICLGNTFAGPIS